MEGRTKAAFKVKIKRKRPDKAAGALTHQETSIRQADGHRRNRQTTIAAAVSVLLHLILFGYLATIVPVLRAPAYAPPRDVELDITPLPLMPRNASPAPITPRQARANAVAAPRSALTASTRRARSSPAPTRAAPARAIAAQRPAPAKAPTAAPAPPSPATASVPAAGSRTGTGAAAGGGGARGGGDVQYGDDGRDGVRAFLRATVGCSHEDYVHLNTQERAACDERVGRDARMMANAHLDTIPSNKRAYYDAVRDAYEQVRNGQGQGPTFGCRFGSKDQGGSNCGFHPPRGFGTEEAGIPKP